MAESKESTAEVSLAALFDGQLNCFGHSDCDIENMAYLICRGGWPRAVTSKNKDAALEMAFDYLSTIAEQDISRADGEVFHYHDESGREADAVVQLRGKARRRRARGAHNVPHGVVELWFAPHHKRAYASFPPFWRKADSNKSERPRL